MNRMHTLALTTLFLMWSQVSWAGLVLTLATSANHYNVGDVGTVDVLIHSNNSPNDQLDSFLIDVNLSGGPGVAFVAPQPERYLAKDFTYVFAGRSTNVAFGLPATAPSNGGMTITAADVSYDFTPVTLGDPLPRVIPDATAPLLLGRFSFNVTGSGDFTIAIDPSSSFSDVGFNTFDFDRANTASFTTAVPEPGSVALLLVGLGLTAFRRKRQPSGNRMALDQQSDVRSPRL